MNDYYLLGIETSSAYIITTIAFSKDALVYLETPSVS